MRSRRRYILFAGVIFLLFVSAFCAGQPGTWVLYASGDHGPINVHTTREDLVRAYGAKNVIDHDVDIGEGETQPGTVLFENVPDRSIEILWNDTETKAQPKELIIRGDKSRWKTLHGISLGTSLKRLEHLNGKPFYMSGYDWDYSGTVTSWDKGALARDLGEFDGARGERGRVILRLTCEITRRGPITEEEQMQIGGDRSFSSNHPVLQKMNPCVGEMVWVFPERLIGGLLSRRPRLGAEPGRMHPGIPLGE